MNARPQRFFSTHLFSETDEWLDRISGLSESLENQIKYLENHFSTCWYATEIFIQLDLIWGVNELTDELKNCNRVATQPKNHSLKQDRTKY